MSFIELVLWTNIQRQEGQDQIVEERALCHATVNLRFHNDDVFFGMLVTCEHTSTHKGGTHTYTQRETGVLT